MGGIAGILGVPNQKAKPAIEKMLRALSHRSPDAGRTQTLIGTSGCPDIFLSSVPVIPSRRSSAGFQPMADLPPNSPMSVNHIVWDGEINNFRELRDTLEKSGWPCRTLDDTEVLLQAYRAWGPGCVTRFQGVFAICAVDPQRGQAWFGRDRMGVKPLYLTRPQTGGLLFASELRTLLAVGTDLVPPTVSRSGMESLLSQGAVFGMASIVENVRLLAPGESLVTDWIGRQISAQSYWRIPFVPEQASPYLPNPSSRARAVQSLSESLRYAVKLSIALDDPVGILLSGGLHSAVLAAIAADLSSKPLQTLHVAFDESTHRAQTAQNFAKTLGAGHQTILLSMEETIGSLPHVLAASDQPSVYGFYNYHVGRAVRRAGFTTAVSAIGGESFFPSGQQCHELQRSLRVQKWSQYLGASKHFIVRLLDKIHRYHAGTVAEMLRRNPNLTTLSLLHKELFRPDERRNFLDKPDNSDPASGLTHDVMLDLTLNCSGMDSVNQISYTEIATLLRNVSLRDADVFGMANGVAMRMPILDHLVVEQIAAMPGFLKSPRSFAKSLLVEAAGNRLDPSLLGRPARTPAFPWGDWLRGPLQHRVGQAMNDRELWQHLGLTPDEPAQAWRRFLRNDRRASAKQIVALMVLEDFVKRHGLRGSGSAAGPMIHTSSVAG